METNIQLSPRNVLRALIGIIVMFALIDSTLNVLQFVMGHDRVFGLVDLMDMEWEGGLPTWYASMQLAAAGVLLSVIATTHVRRRNKHALAWCVLALGFFFMSFDEVAAFHEEWGLLVKGLVRREGIFYFRWVVVAIPLCAVLFVFFLGLIRSLSARTRRGTMIAAGIFLGGALGLEMVSAYVVDTVGPGLLYAMVYMVENAMELLGIALYIHVLLRYMTEELFAPEGVKIQTSAAAA